MSCGCPQGSALSPLLWNVFQNDLTYCLTANLSMYADDHQIYHAGADQAAVTFQLKDSANLATTWYDSNLLAGNLKKYQVLNLGFIQNDSDICVSNVEIETKDNIILLGVVLDSKLNFSEHIISICKKASQRIGVLMRLRNLIPMKSKLILFKSAILPFLTYCHLVWHFCKASDIRKLERLRERGLRALFKDNNSSYEQLLENAELPTLLNRRLQDLCILMYKVKHKLCTAYISNNLRQADFSIPRYETVT